MRVLIAGGGIGGLAAAVALKRIGADPIVFERAPEIREVGAGLSLWSNAVAALDRLGVLERLEPRTSRCDRAITQTAEGRELDVVDMSPITEKAGYPTLFAHRAELQQALLDAVGVERVRTGRVVAGFEQDARGVRLQFEDGAAEAGDVLIGADGLRSTIRAALFGSDEPPRYSGYTSWRGIAPVDLENPTTHRFILGPGAQGGIHPCGRGRTYWFLTHNAQAGGTDAPGGHHDAVRAVVAEWSSPLADLVERTPENAISRHDIADRPPVSTWGDGRVTLLGDAVHSTTPNLGQGACMALEDAVVLGHHLARAASPAEGLRAYEADRKARTAFVTNTSRRLGALFQLENAFLRKIRDMILHADFAHSQGIKSMTELLVHELPTLGGVTSPSAPRSFEASSRTSS